MSENWLKKKHFSCGYIYVALPTDQEGLENSGQLCKPKTQSKVCILIMYKDSPNLPLPKCIDEAM